MLVFGFRIVCMFDVSFRRWVVSEVREVCLEVLRFGSKRFCFCLCFLVVIR